jgi:hypothetical protein
MQGDMTMAVNHMVWMKFRPEVDAARIAAHLEALRGIEGRIPGVQSLTLGRNFTDRANGFTHGLSVILDDKAALAAYGPHPYHVEVATALRRDAELLVLDFEY